MKLHDVTGTIYPGMPVYPGDPEVRIENVTGIGDGSSASVSEYKLGSHTGTHVDPPSHFVPGGMSVDEIPLDVLIGPAVVVDARGSVIDRNFIEGSGLTGVRRALFRTRGGKAADTASYFTADAAAYLAGLGVTLVGIDGPSVDGPDSAGHDAHRTLLGNGVVVVEGLELSAVGPGAYQLVCLPMKVKGGDGAPARVVLIEE